MSITPDPKYTDPKLWGPHFWHMMRTVAHNYPMTPSGADKSNTKVFFVSIGNILPCKKCKDHYKSLMTKNTIDDKLCCKTCLIKWVENIYTEIKKI